MAAELFVDLLSNLNNFFAEYFKHFDTVNQIVTLSLHALWLLELSWLVFILFLSGLGRGAALDQIVTVAVDGWDELDEHNLVPKRRIRPQELLVPLQLELDSRQGMESVN